MIPDTQCAVHSAVLVCSMQYSALHAAATCNAEMLVHARFCGMAWNGTLATLNSSVAGNGELPQQFITCGACAGGQKGSNTALKKGVQDISVMKVPIGPSDEMYPGRSSPEHAEHSQSQSAGDAVLLAVTTRSCQLAVFGWPDLHSQQDTVSKPHAASLIEVHQMGDFTEGVDAQPSTSPLPVDSNPYPVPSPLAGKPTFLEQLSVPPSTGEVTWLPICWLPHHLSSTAEEAHDQADCSLDTSNCLGTKDESVFGVCPQSNTSESPASTDTNLPRLSTISTVMAGSGVPGQDGISLCAQRLCAWLLVGLPSGRMCLWSLKINTRAFMQLHVHGLPSHPSHSAPVQEACSAVSSASASWRTGASDGGACNDTDRGSSARNSGGMGWRKSTAIEVKPVKLSSDDVHIRMLFTIHASPGSALDSSAPRSWQVISTSYDRKTVGWELRIDEDGDAACMKACNTWTGTGADVLAMCTGQVSYPFHLRFSCRGNRPSIT